MTNFFSSNYTTQTRPTTRPTIFFFVQTSWPTFTQDQLQGQLIPCQPIFLFLLKPTTRSIDLQSVRPTLFTYYLLFQHRYVAMFEIRLDKEHTKFLKNNTTASDVGKKKQHLMVKVWTHNLFNWLVTVESNKQPTDEKTYVYVAIYFTK